MKASTTKTDKSEPKPETLKLPHQAAPEQQISKVPQVSDGLHIQAEQEPPQVNKMQEPLEPVIISPEFLELRDAQIAYKLVSKDLTKDGMISLKQDVIEKPLTPEPSKPYEETPHTQETSKPSESQVPDKTTDKLNMPEDSTQVKQPIEAVIDQSKNEHITSNIVETDLPTVPAIEACSDSKEEFLEKFEVKVPKKEILPIEIEKPKNLPSETQEKFPTEKEMKVSEEKKDSPTNVDVQPSKKDPSEEQSLHKLEEKSPEQIGNQISELQKDHKMTSEIKEKPLEETKVHYIEPYIEQKFVDHFSLEAPKTQPFKEEKHSKIEDKKIEEIPVNLQLFRKQRK